MAAFKVGVLGVWTSSFQGDAGNLALLLEEAGGGGGWGSALQLFWTLGKIDPHKTISGFFRQKAVR